MKKTSLPRIVTAAVLIALGSAGTLLAQAVTDSAQRMEKHRVDLSGAPDMEVIVSTGEYKPGESIDLHSHHGIEALYVMQGADVQAPGQAVRTLPEGATKVNLRDVEHAGFRVVGESSLKILTVHVVDKGKPLYVYPD